MAKMGTDYVRRASEGGNATVPGDAPIQPPQAFVDAIPQLLPGDPIKYCGNSGVIDLANRGLTKISGDYLHIAIQTGGPGNIDLSGGALPASEVNALLARFVENEDAAVVLDLSGGTNAVPTLPVFVIDFNSIVIGEDQQFGQCAVSEQAIVAMPIGLNLSASSVDFSSSAPFARIGTADFPTKQAVINKLVSLGGGKIVDLGGLIIRVSPTDYNLEPLDFSGMTGSSLTQGNNDIGMLRATGWTVITN